MLCYHRQSMRRTYSRRNSVVTTKHKRTNVLSLLSALIRRVFRQKVNRASEYALVMVAGLVRFYTGLVGSCLPTFRDSLSVPPPRTKRSPRRIPETGTIIPFIGDGADSDWISLKVKGPIRLLERKSAIRTGGRGEGGKGEKRCRMGRCQSKTVKLKK